MEFNLDPDSKELKFKNLTLKSTSGFTIFLRQKEGESTVRLYQEIYGEEVFIMKITREQIADIVYALEDFL